VPFNRLARLKHLLVDISSTLSPFVRLQERLTPEIALPKLFLQEQRSLLLLGIKNHYITMTAWHRNNADGNNADNADAGMADVGVTIKVPIYAMTFF
jgi:hypothetical protein